MHSCNDKCTPTGSSYESDHVQQQFDCGSKVHSDEKQLTNTTDSQRSLSVPQPMECSLNCHGETTLDGETMDIDQNEDEATEHQNLCSDNVVTTGIGIGASEAHLIDDISINYDQDSVDGVCPFI